MGLMDKVKEQAAAAAKSAKDAAAKGQAKVDEMQAKRAADATLRQLGLAIYLEKAGRPGASTDADVAGFVETLKAYEAEHGELSKSDES
ncbi:MAG: hypothetical protein ACRDV0_08475 [Acidimicrobiales bacterium]